MSLDVYLKDDDGDVLFWTNITHNLGRMAKEAGIYEAIWRPEEVPASCPKHVIETIETGLLLMKSDPDRFKKYDSDNGWGTYDQFVPWVEELLHAYKEMPELIIYTSR